MPQARPCGSVFQQSAAGQLSQHRAGGAALRPRNPWVIAEADKGGEVKMCSDDIFLHFYWLHSN